MPSRKIIFILLIISFLIITQSGCSKSTTAEINSETYELKGMLLIAELQNGDLLTVSAIDNNKPQKNALYIVAKDGNQKTLIAESSNNKPIYSATLAANDWVIFAEATDDMICSDWEIKALNLNSKEVYSIDQGNVAPSELKVGATTFMAPLLDSSGSRVVWSTFEKDDKSLCNAVVRLYDVETKETLLIDTNNNPLDEFGHPKLDGDFVVYDKGHIDNQAGGRNGIIYMKNLKTDEVKELDRGIGVTEACIKYPYVAWNSGNHIKLYDVREKDAKIISDSSQSWTPSINDNYVTWLNPESTVYLYKLPTGPMIKIFSGDTAIGGALKNNLLIWLTKDKENLTYKYMNLLSADWPQLMNLENKT